MPVANPTARWAPSLENAALRAGAPTVTLACRVEICQINLMRAKCAAALRVSAADYELSCWPAACQKIWNHAP